MPAVLLPIIRLRLLGVEYYCRYVDDTFVILDNAINADLVLEFLNKQHPNIKFTMEMEQKNKLPFLDVLVVKRIDILQTTIYRKKTFTGVMLNWNSFTSKRYKIGLITCLLNRAWRICSNYSLLDVEIQKIRFILLSNNYPEKIVDKEISRFLNLYCAAYVIPEVVNMTNKNSISATHTHIDSSNSEVEIDEDESILTNDESNVEEGSIAGDAFGFIHLKVCF